MTDDFDISHLKLMKKAIALFNAQKYWECHEELEHHWLEETGPLRNVYWAVIQVAASMIHYRDGNLVGAKGLLVKSKEKFKRVESFKIENKLLNEELDWQQLKELVFKVPAEPQLEDFKDLFEFRFKEIK